MAHHSHLPCNGNGMCMRCKTNPREEEKMSCNMCATPWHVKCLARPPETLASALHWECPDCSLLIPEGNSVLMGGKSGELMAAIRAIEADESLSEQNKARRRQGLMISGMSVVEDGDCSKEKKKDKVDEILDILKGNLNCAFCYELPDRPVTTPCGHNFCLKCFQKWIGLGKRICVKCRQAIPPQMVNQPRINSALLVAIGMALMSNSTASDGSPCKNQNRSEIACTTERAERKHNGEIFVSVQPGHFGPILAEDDPVRNQGVLVGQCWENRLQCRQWGIHFTCDADVSGHAQYGAHSVVLSGGNIDEDDYGQWFFYTRTQTNKDNSFDEKFEGINEALRVSCIKGHPVRVVREAGSRWGVGCHKIKTKLIWSHKEKHAPFAPEKGLRYDGIYRIEKCWQHFGSQGIKVCRYLFVRCDNNPAPWTSDGHGDRPRPLPAVSELGTAFNITKRKESPSWDFNEQDASWKWVKSPPPNSGEGSETLKNKRISKRRIRESQSLTFEKKLLNEFSCIICKKVMTLPVTTPCAHNFCKVCLESAFTVKTYLRKRTGVDGRPLRVQKNVIKCPSCPCDISDFLKDPQVNRELKDVIELLKCKAKGKDDS